MTRRSFCTVRVLEGERVEVVLAGQSITHHHIVRQHTGADDPPIGGQSCLHEVVEDHGHMRTVETADAEVDDARPHRRPVGGGTVMPRSATSARFCSDGSRFCADAARVGPPRRGSGFPAGVGAVI
jgi:hypothetical protein